MSQKITEKIPLLEKQLKKNSKKTSPKYLDTLHALGTAYLETGRNKEGLNCFLKRVEIAPKAAKYYCSLGWAYLHLGDFTQAETAYKKASDLSPSLVQAKSGLIDVYYRQGKIDVAFNIIKVIFDKQKALKPNESIAALRVYAKLCYQFDHCDECIDTLSNALKSSKLTKESRVSLLFSMATLFDKRGEFKKAFDFYNKANDLNHITYLHKAESQRNEAIISGFSKNKRPAIREMEDTPLNPIFIIGMPRSGTSLLEQILSRHTDVFAAGELVTMTEISNVLYTQCNYPVSMENLTENVLEQAAKHYQTTLSGLVDNETRVTDKMPANYMHLGLISLLFPDATIIHTQRNPIDTCLSIYFQRFPGTHTYATQLNNIANYYLEYQRLMRHWQSVLPTTIHNVYYEQLASEQEAVTRSLLKHCELDWQESCLDFHQSDRVVTTASQDQVKQKMYQTSINRWKNYNEFIPESFKKILSSQQKSYLEFLDKG